MWNAMDNYDDKRITKLGRRSEIVIERRQKLGEKM